MALGFPRSQLASLARLLSSHFPPCVLHVPDFRSGIIFSLSLLRAYQFFKVCLVSQILPEEISGEDGM